MVAVCVGVAVVLAAWFLENAIHEGSHLLMAYNKRGWPPVEYKPYPCKVDGRWYFAYCRYDNTKETAKKGEASEIHIAPFYAGLAWACLWLTPVAILAGTGNWQWWSWYFLAPIVTGVVDALFFWWGYFWGSKFTDGKKYKYLKGKKI
jgi:hypothetical protein